MSEGAKLRLYNTLTRAREEFVPLDAANVRMYVCGPTVYDFAHIGNARPVIVFDVLFRLLRHLYGDNSVTYVRNITDVDDKINARALRDFGQDIAAGRLTLNEAIRRVTEKTANQFHEDVANLGCLPPTVEPRATENIEQMISMIQQLLNLGHAYVAQGEDGREALFDIKSMPAYGRLAGRNLDDQQAGARVSVEPHKRNAGDFVLWKESAPNEPGWEAQFLLTEDNRQNLKLNDAKITIFGRPGWHIECSAMSNRYLWEELQETLSPSAKARRHQFDIHGGGLDLIFPHHENEIAQSCCAHGSERMARYWLHNGFLQVEGRKMSKSEGNFVTIHELLATDKFGGRSWPGEVLRLAMLKTHYRQPIDWTMAALQEAHSELANWASILQGSAGVDIAMGRRGRKLPPVPDQTVVSALLEDINTPAAIAALHTLSSAAKRDSVDGALIFMETLEFLGLLRSDMLFAYNPYHVNGGKIIDQSLRTFLDEMQVAYLNGMFQRLEEIQKYLAGAGVSAEVRPGGGVSYQVSSHVSLDVDEFINRRLAFIRDKNWAEADRIRDELLAQGIQLKDGKDPVTGERVTTWEVRR